MNSKLNRKLPLASAAIIVIMIVVFTLFSMSWSKIGTISLETHYAVGEKLTYNLTSIYTSQKGAETVTAPSTQSTVIIEVLSVNPDSYLLNYTVIPDATEGAPISKILEVNHSDAINLFTLMPVALLQYTPNTDYSIPLETAILSRQEAKFGETIHIPVICSNIETPQAEITIKPLEAEDIEVEAGNFKVFRLEFAQVQQTSRNPEEGYAGVLGWALLEVGSCKPIKSGLQFNMTTTGESAVTTFESTLIKTESV